MEVEVEDEVAEDMNEEVDVDVDVDCGDVGVERWLTLHGEKKYYFLVLCV
jgi:hypothetical protein